MGKCIDHEPCPYRSHEKCHEMVVRIRDCMWKADEAFEQIGGGTRHYVRESLIAALAADGLMVVEVEK